MSVPHKFQPGYKPHNRHQSYNVKRFQGLSIQPKIMLGYLLSLGIAVGGCISGFYISNVQRQSAQRLLNEAQKELAVPVKIQEQLTTAILSQRLLPSLLHEPDIWMAHKQNFETAIVNAQQVWQILQASYAEPQPATEEPNGKLDAIESLFKKYAPLLEDYHRRVNNLIAGVDPTQISDQELAKIQADLLELNSNALLKAVNAFEGHLGALVEILSNEVVAAETALAEANRLRDWITLGSLITATLISVTLSFQISQTITQPLKQSAQIAQQVADEDNFELQAPVTSHDEVGQLTQTLNLLIQRVKVLLQEQETTQTLLIHNEKMSVLGNLVAGVAHEINNPLGFVSGNITEMRHAFQDMASCLQCYRETFPEPGEDIEALLEASELDFLLEDTPKMLDSMKVGCDRIRSISTSLRTFSRADTEIKFKANVHEGLDSTLLILKYRLKGNNLRPEIEVIRNYGHLPEIDCFPGQLNQVFMNLLANAIDMFDEIAEQRSLDNLTINPQQITIRTQLIEPQRAEIYISDNGYGMSKEVRSKIFDHKFTTKGVGKGTGLGLAIAHQVVVEKHGGSLEVESELDQGTAFLIRLPITD